MPLALVLTLLLVICFFCVWRSSGGKPGLWVKYHCSHSNPKYKVGYLAQDVRKQMEEELMAPKEQYDPIAPGVMSRFSPNRMRPAASSQRVLLEGSW